MARADRIDEADPPTGSNDLLPTRLYPAELVMMPFFWLLPLNLVLLGGAIYLDRRTLARFGVEPEDGRWRWYLLAALFAHLGTALYRFQRRACILEALGVSRVAFGRQLEAAEPPTSKALGGSLALQFLLVGFVLVGNQWMLAGLFLNAVLAPPLVWWDLRRVRSFEGVAWGWPRYLHVVASAVPPLLFIYAVQRYEHIAYAMVVRLWTVDPESVAVERSELSRVERFGEWLADRG